MGAGRLYAVPEIAASHCIAAILQGFRKDPTAGPDEKITLENVGRLIGNAVPQAFWTGCGQRNQSGCLANVVTGFFLLSLDFVCEI